MARIPYLNEWTVEHTVYKDGSAVQPTSITCAVTNANGSAVSLAATPAYDASAGATLLTFSNTEVNASAYGTRWTALWTGNACGTDFTDPETLIVVKSGEEGLLSTVCECVEHLESAGVSDPTKTSVGYALASADQQAKQKCGRMFTYPPVTEARYVGLLGELTVYPDELVSISTSGVVDSSANDMTYNSLPGTRAGDFIRSVSVYDDYSPYIVITGEWGWDAIPADINHAVMLLTESNYRRYLAQTTIGGDFDGTPVGFDQRVVTALGIINRYARLSW